MKEIHETVITQLFKIRNNFILPLQECPFYYEALDKYVRHLLINGKTGNKNYYETISTLTAN